MLVTLKSILQKAHNGNYAVGAFNVNNLEILDAVIRAAEKMKSPVVVQTSEGGVHYAGMEEVVALMRVEAKKAKVPVAVHLDHGKDVALVRKAIASGYTSVMIDGSALVYNKNVSITKDIVRRAHAKKISVEAELGAIAGIEDFVSVAERDAHFTSPEQAVDFVKKTKCDALAIAVGTSHGAYKFKTEPRLDIERIKEIKTLTKLPLVLHGASGISPELLKRMHKHCSVFGDCARLEGARGVSDRMIRLAIKAGINKINIDSDLRIAFTAAVREQLLKDKKTFDPRIILGSARTLMQKVVEEKMKLFRSAGKA